MKKIIATVLAAVMILSILATLAVIPAAAADDKEAGDWAVYTDPGSYKDEGGEYLYDYSDPTTSDMDIPGYEYTDEGFKVSGEYTTEGVNTKPRIQITTKEKQNLKKGISMTVEVTGFKADPGSDRWFSFYIWDQPNPAQGNVTGEFGQGYASLNRCTVIQNFISDQAFYDWTGTMSDPGSPTAPCTWSFLSDKATAGTVHATNPDENGVYTLTLDLIYDSATDYYTLYNQGIQVTPVEVVNNYFHQRFADGYAYVGFGLFNSGSDCTTTVTITEFNGEKPTGTDKADQVYNAEPMGPMIDTSTLDPSAPALLFNAKNEKKEFEKDAYMHTCDGTYVANLHDGSFRIYPESHTKVTYFSMSPDNDYTYEASDFPYAAVLFRNFCNCQQFEGMDYACEGKYGHTLQSVYYCSGANTSPGMNCRIDLEPQVEEYEDYYGNTYQLFLVDFSLFGPDWQGRINLFRVDVQYTEYMLSDEDTNFFDLCYIAFFQTEEAALNYAANYAEEYEPCAHDGEIIVTPEVPAQCTDTGWRETQQCAVCNQYLVPKKRLPALGHSYTPSEYIAPTCTEVGREAGQECTRCGLNSSMGIDALGHVEIYASDDEAHWIACKRDGCDYAKNPEPHTIGENDVCTVCGHGCPHASTEWSTTTGATCTTPGLKSEICNDCGATVNSETIPALGHTEEVLPAVDPTCTDAGRTEGKHCAVCKAVTVVQVIIPALDHTEEEIPAVDATCKDTGLTAGKKCTVCGTVTVEQTETPVTAHTYDNDTDADCNACGEKRTIATQPPVDNTPNEGGDNAGGEEEKGCGSVIGLGAFAVIATIGLAGVACFKKKD